MRVSDSPLSPWRGVLGPGCSARHSAWVCVPEEAPLVHPASSLHVKHANDLKIKRIFDAQKEISSLVNRPKESTSPSSQGGLGLVVVDESASSSCTPTPFLCFLVVGKPLSTWMVEVELREEIQNAKAKSGLLTRLDECRVEKSLGQASLHT